MSDNLTGYELSKDWFDFCFDNPELITPTHTALYFFTIEHCNRLGWKPKFGLPTNMAMDAIGVKNWRTYSKALNDLIDFGFLKLIEKSKNQYSATVIAIVKNTKASTKALTKAIQKHVQKQSSSIAVIDKPITIKPLTNKQYIQKGFFLNEFDKDYQLSEIEVGKVIQFIKLKTQKDLTGPEILDQWTAFKIDNFDKREWKNSIEDVISHFRNSLKIQTQKVIIGKPDVKDVKIVLNGRN